MKSLTKRNRNLSCASCNVAFRYIDDLTEVVEEINSLHSVRPPKAGIEHVYIAHAKHTGFVKIGLSNDIKKRLRMMQTGCPFKLRLLCFEIGGARRESYLHSKFRHRWIRGEWFGVDQQLFNYVINQKSRGVSNGTS